MNWKNIALPSVALVVALTLTACSDESKSADTVATFDGEKVTKDELFNEMVRTYGDQSINALLANKIAEEEADKLKIDISKDELAENISLIKSQYGTSEAFDTMLKTSGMTMKDLEADLKKNLILEKVLMKRIKNTDEELKAHFDGNTSNFGSPAEVKASHILVDTSEKAQEIFAELKGGADFAELAKKHSTDKGSATEGGELGFFTEGKMVPEFDAVAFKLAVGEISEPVQSEFGFHIIKVAEKKEAIPAEFEASKESVNDAVTKQKMQSEYGTWMEEKFKEYKVEIKL